MSATLYFVAQEDWSCSVPPAEVPILSQMVGPSFGRTFPVFYRAAVISSLGWSSEQVVEIPTCHWGIDQLQVNPVRPMLPDVKIVHHQEPTEAWRGYLEITADWCRQNNVGLPVCIHFDWGKHPLYANGQFHLCFGGSAGFGISFWSRGRDIHYQRNHCWIGELGPEHDHCRQLIVPLLQLCVPCALGSKTNDQQDNFVAICGRWVAQERRHVEQSVIESEQAIGALQTRFVEAIRRLTVLRHRQEDLRPLGAAQAVYLQDLYQQLLTRSYVRALVICDPIISIFTGRVLIALENQGLHNGLYDIGEFRLDIDTSGSHGCVKLFNLSRQISSGSGRPKFHHPHVDEGGNPCLGSIREVIPRYVGQGEYLAACDLLWGYLHAVNPQDHYGRSIVCWPKFSVA